MRCSVAAAVSGCAAGFACGAFALDFGRIPVAINTQGSTTKQSSIAKPGTEIHKPFGLKRNDGSGEDSDVGRWGSGMELREIERADGRFGDKPPFLAGG